MQLKEFFEHHKRPVAKVIFLDFDGPLSTFRSMMLTDSNYEFDPVSVGILNHICEAGNVRVVCTSSRTFFHSKPLYNEAKHFFEKAGFDWRNMHPDWCVNKTNNSGADYDRAQEIANYLQNHSEITHYAVVDDEKVNMNNFVFVNEEDGISYRNIGEICKYLDVCQSSVYQLARKKSPPTIGQLNLLFDQRDAINNELILKEDSNQCQPS